MVILEVRCPACSKRGKIEVSEEEVKNTTKGLYAVNVKDKMICDHSFVVYVDKNLVVRDSFIADFQIDMPVSVSKKEIEKDIGILPKSFDVSLLRINFTASVLAYFLKAIIRRKKIIIISEKEFLHEHLSNFLRYICSESFDVEFDIIKLKDYDSEKYGNHIVIQENEVIKDDDNIFASKNVKVERTIIQTFLNEIEPMTSIVLLKSELTRIYQLSEIIVDMIKNLKKNETLYSKKVISDLANIRGIQIQIPYLEYLYEVVEYYFGVTIPKSSSISNFLGTL
jgi:hypothetical protein